MLRTLTINPVLNGFVVQFGCQQLAYTDTTKMLGDLGDYLREPEETEKKLLAKECFNRRHTLGNAVPTPVPGNRFAENLQGLRTTNQDCAGTQTPDTCATGMAAGAQSLR